MSHVASLSRLTLFALVKFTQLPGCELAGGVLNVNQGRYHAASTRDFSFGPDATLVDVFDHG